MGTPVRSLTSSSSSSSESRVTTAPTSSKYLASGSFLISNILTFWRSVSLTSKKSVFSRNIWCTATPLWLLNEARGALRCIVFQCCPNRFESMLPPLSSSTLAARTRNSVSSTSFTAILLSLLGRPRGRLGAIGMTGAASIVLGRPLSMRVLPDDFHAPLLVVGRYVPYSDVHGDRCTATFGLSLDVGDGRFTDRSRASLSSSSVSSDVGPSGRGGM
mmetsp:Transcript_13379/g.32695  ORF Transcript_13379/g.32695 Transcript_13379/m.32695 type:complete len:217 (-) Transcript_13379:259-909(-)